MKDRYREQARSHSSLCWLRRSGVFEQVVQFDELLRQLVPRIEMDQRCAGLVRFAHAHLAGKVNRQHRQAFGDQFVEHLLRQAGPGLELVDHDAFDFQAFVVVVLQLFDLRHQPV